MIGIAPYFIDSLYLIIDEKGWRLKDDAPDKLKEDFKKYMESLEFDRSDE